MNKTNLKRYAPEARKDFIAAVTARANLLGLGERAGKPHAEPCEVRGDVALIGGRPWPANVQGRREALLKLVEFPVSALENVEKLEQLRALDNGMQIGVVQVDYESVGVDTPEDVARVEGLLKSGKF